MMETETTYLEMTPHISIVRVYDQPDGYARRLPYLGSLVVTHLTDTTVWVHTAVGKVTRDTYEKALAMLREQGVTTLMAERHGDVKTIRLAGRRGA